MTLFDDIAERRIQAAQDAGEFDRLPGMGRPLVISEDFSMPIEVRLVHRRLMRAAQEEDRYSLAAQMRLRRLMALVEQRRLKLRRSDDTTPGGEP
jgi:hypothetical protein